MLRYKYRGLGQGEPRAGRAAGARVQAGTRRVAPWRDHVLAVPRLHGARVRRREVRAVLAPSLHRLHLPDAGRSVDGASRKAHHELLRAVRALPPCGRQGVDDERARRVRRERDRHDRGALPGHPLEDRGQARSHAEGHRGLHRPHRGQHLPGRALARAAVLQPAGARLVALPHARARPVDVRLGHAPRRRHHGRDRPHRGPRVPEGEGRRDGGRPDGEVGGRRHRRGPQRARRRRLPRESRQSVIVLERATRSAASCGTEIAPGFTRPGSPTPWAACARSCKDLQLEQHGLELLTPDVRLFAPQPDGSAVTFWGDAARTPPRSAGATRTTPMPTWSSTSGCERSRASSRTSTSRRRPTPSRPCRTRSWG